jgi:hypothetical protein
MAKVIGNWAGAFGYTNILLFGVFLFRHDAIERPNVIGYFSLAVSLAVLAAYYFSRGRCFQDALKFSFFFCLGLIATLHNANFLVATDYGGRYSVEDKRLASNGTESWRLDLGNGKQIDLHVSSPPDGGGSDLRLKKGLFGVYFGIAVDDSSGQ